MVNSLIPYSTDLANGEQVFQQLGGFWNNVYEGKDLVKAYARSLGLLTMQSFNDLQELVGCSGRVDIPLYHTKKWLPLLIKQSEVLPGNVPKYGDVNTVYGQQTNGATYYYGKSKDSSVAYVTADETLQNVNVICNRITDPSVALIRGIDFEIDTASGVLIFQQDPFTNSNIPSQPVLNAQNLVIDQEITLWLFQVEFDKQYIYKHFGYVLGINYSTSQNYKDFVNAVFDSITGNSSVATLQSALTAITDIPLVIEDAETVKEISQDNLSKLVITDKNVYRIATTATITVSVGAILRGGDPLTNSLLIYDFTSGRIPSSSEIASFTVPKTYIQINGLVGGLTFSNSLQATTVSTVSSHTKVTFPITGDAGDITTFWATVHTNGIAAGQTLAHLLDNRDVKIGEPTAANLPATINPFGFLVQNVFRNNLILLKIKTADFGPNALGTTAVKYLRKIVPSHVSLFIQYV
jgi:hypothetical protein